MKYFAERCIGTAFSLDDIMLVPQKSNVQSREYVSTNTSLTPRILLGHPIVSSCMSTVTELQMMLTMAKTGGIGFLHRFMEPKEILDILRAFKEKAPGKPAVLPIGVKQEDYDLVESAFNEGIDVAAVLVDVAHGHSDMVTEIVKNIKKTYPVEVIAGNVAGPDGFCALAEAGADAIRVGVSGGSVCTTRSVTGHGLPTLYSVALCAEVRNERYPDTRIIADGGVRTSGDIVKFLAFGADTVCVGNLLAATSDTPGAVLEIDGQKVKEYYGMSSKVAQDRLKGGLRRGIAAEGIDVLQAYKGDTTELVEKTVAGVRSGMAYAGAYDIDELRRNFEFVMLATGAINHNSTNWSN